MFTPKEIVHPLCNIHLMADETKAMSEKENNLLDSFLKLHDKTYEFKQEIKKLNDFFSDNHQDFHTVNSEFKSIEEQMHRFPETKLKLQIPQAGYKIFREQYDAFMEEAWKYEDAYNIFYPKFDKLAIDTRKLIKMSDQLRSCKDDVDKIIDSIYKSEAAVCDDPNQMALDWNHFEKEYQTFLGRVDESTAEFRKIDDEVDDYYSDEFKPLIDQFNEGSGKMKEFFSTIGKLHDAYLMYTKAKDAGSSLVYIEWYEREAFRNYDDFVDYGMSYDMEYGPKGGLILHLDTHLIIEGILDCSVRNTYRMKCTLTEAFTNEVMEPLIGHGIEMMKGEIHGNVKKDKRSFDMARIEISYYITEQLTKIFIEGITSKEDFGKIKDDSFNRVFTFKSPQELQLVGVTSLNVMNQLFFLNNNFDHRKMRAAFNEVLSFDQYLTLEALLPQIDKGPITLNTGQYMLLLALIDCATQLLLGDHEEDFLEGLENVGITAEHRKVFLKAAQANLNAGKKSITKPNSNISPLEDLPDWNKIFF